MCIILVYDVTDRMTFTSIRNWYAQIRMHAAVDIPVCLVGNKCDMEDQRAVSFAEGLFLAKEYGSLFFEASAKADINCEYLFQVLYIYILY